MMDKQIITANYSYSIGQLKYKKWHIITLNNTKRLIE